MKNVDLYKHADSVNELLARYGVKFGIYKNGTFKEQLFSKTTRYIANKHYACIQILGIKFKKHIRK